ncbi:MAG: polysaccharide biosynthesis protein, partial [Spirochaetaceae bacterium]|nr:polysaccharide biosynthesis protein [Spirochaetaceae bacterium]
PVKTEYKRILRVEREGPALDLGSLTAELEPVVHFDPAAPERYRDSALLRGILRKYIPSLAEKDHDSRRDSL